jgi:hypothetical protein
MGDVNQTEAPASPADLVERNAPAPQPQANTAEVSPADLVERSNGPASQQQDQQQRQSRGIGL